MKPGFLGILLASAAMRLAVPALFAADVLFLQPVLPR